jgi:hypothetical protein
MSARPSSAVATVVAVIAACATAAGCGGGPSKPLPSQRDVAVITTSVSDVVYQCQSAAAEFIAAPDHGALKRDVDRLVSAAARLRADAPFRSARGPRTTLRQQLALAARNLRARCSPEQAARLDDAIK